MSEQSNEATTVEDEREEPASTDEVGQNQISLDLEALTQEGREKAEKELKRKIEDLSYALENEEERPGSLRVMSFVLENDVYKREEERMLSDLNQEITLPGFRRGKAPLNLLRRRLGDEVVKESISSVSTNVLRQVVTGEKLKLLSKPKVTDYDLEYQEGVRVRLEIEIELEPTVELKEYRGIEVDVETDEFSESSIDERLEELRRHNSVVENAGKNAKISEGDRIVIDVEVTSAKGERLAHLCQSDQELWNYMSQMPSPISDKLTGTKIGESIEADIENKSTNRKGDEIIHTDHHTVTVKEIKRDKLPKLDDDFAKDLGDHETLEDLRDAIRGELSENSDKNRRTSAVAEIWKKISELNPVDVPRTLMAQQQYSMIMQDNYQLQRMGLSLDRVVQDPERYLTDQQSGAEQSVRIGLLNSRLMEIEKLAVTEEEVESEIERIAEETGRKVLAVRARLEADNELDELRSSLVSRKVGDFLIENNSVKYVAPKKQDKAGGEASGGD